MTFPIKMKNIVFALFRTYWNTDLPSSINNIATISNSISISTFLNFHSKGQFTTKEYFTCDFQIRPYSSSYATYYHRADMTMGTDTNNNFVIKQIDDYSLKITWNYIDVPIKQYTSNYYSTTASAIFGPNGISYTPYFTKDTRFWYWYIV